MCTNENGLPRLAVLLLSVVANTGDTERMFSGFGLIHTKLRNRLLPDTVHKINVVRMHIRRCHAAAGLICQRLKRKLTAITDSPGSTGNHISTSSHSPSVSGTGDTDGMAGGSEETDFQALSEDLVAQSIQSRERFEAEEDNEHEDGDEMMLGGGQPRYDAGAASHGALAPSASIPTPTTSAIGAAPTPRRTQRRAQSNMKTNIPLAQLFRFPAQQAIPPPDEHGFGFVWTSGIRNLEQEVELVELLQLESSTAQ